LWVWNTRLTICFPLLLVCIPYHFVLFSHMRIQIPLTILTLYLVIQITFLVVRIFFSRITLYLARGRCFLFSSHFFVKYTHASNVQLCIPMRKIMLLREGYLWCNTRRYSFPQCISLLSNILFISVMFLVGESINFRVATSLNLGRALIPFLIVLT